MAELPERRDAMPGARFTETALALDAETPFERWAQIGQTLGRLHRCSAWWLGDWVNFGERAYGEKYAQAMDVTGLAYGTLANYASVAARVPVSQRCESLTWAHHRPVAALGPAEQGRWLERAAAEGWTEKELRRRLRRPRPTRVDVPHAGAGYRVMQADVAEATLDEPADLILTDPPYGGDAIDLYGKLGAFANRTLRDGGSLVVMCGQYHLPAILRELEVGVLRYQWALAYMTPGAANPVFQRRVNCAWKPVVWLAKGEYDGPWLGDVARSDRPEKSRHAWQQSESGMAGLLERFSQPGELVVDPFLGAGTTGAVALKLGRRFVGFDIDEACVQVAAERLAA